LFDVTTQTCELHNLVVPSSVFIERFSISIPEGQAGPLCCAETVVIPDLEFTILITYPLTRSVEVPVKVSKRLTLKELLSLIQSIYEVIYEQDEKTSTPIQLTYETDCKECLEKSAYDIISSLEQKESNQLEGDCSICFNSLTEEKQICLPCNHVFHEHCILYWIKHGNGESCPFCRRHFIQCENCNNTKRIEVTNSFNVVPPHLRTSTIQRNELDGTFGIKGIDFEFIQIFDLWYNKHTKLLQVFAGV
jgi:hypothetical protein